MSLVRHVHPGVGTLICRKDTGREATPRGYVEVKDDSQTMGIPETGSDISLFSCEE